MAQAPVATNLNNYVGFHVKTKKLAPNNQDDLLIIFFYRKVAGATAQYAATNWEPIARPTANFNAHVKAVLDWLVDWEADVAVSLHVHPLLIGEIYLLLTSVLVQGHPQTQQWRLQARSRSGPGQPGPCNTHSAINKSGGFHRYYWISAMQYRGCFVSINATRSLRLRHDLKDQGANSYPTHEAHRIISLVLLRLGI